MNTSTSFFLIQAPPYCFLLLVRLLYHRGIPHINISLLLRNAIMNYWNELEKQEPDRPGELRERLPSFSFFSPLEPASEKYD